jgi:superfamily II DNA or RNA helicase
VPKPLAADRLSPWRAHFSVEVQKRGEELARGGAVELLANDGAKVSTRVHAKHQTHEVEVDLRTKSLRDVACTCSAFRLLGNCEHVWATLAVTVIGLSPRTGDPRGEELRAWMASLSALEQRLLAHDTEVTADETSFVEYVLVLDDAEAAASTVLETRRRKPLSRGGYGKASPFALLAPRKDVKLTSADRAIAALLRGAASALFSPTLRSREETRYFLDAEQTAALIGPLAATGRLYSSRRGDLDGPLELRADEGWRAAVRLHESEPGGALELEAFLLRGLERTEASAIRGVLAGDTVVLAGSLVRATLGRARAWLVNMLLAPPPPFARADAQLVLLELARRELDAEPGPGMEDLIAARRPTPHLLLAAPTLREGQSVVQGTVEFDYGLTAIGGNTRVPPSDRRPLLPTGRGVLRRYFEVEESLIAPALALGATRPSPDMLVLELERVPELVRGLAEAGWVVQGEGTKYRALGRLKLALASGIDWFELEGRIEGAPKGAFPALLAALKRGESTVALGDGTLAIVPEDWVERWRSALLLGDASGGRVRFRQHQAWLVDLLLSELLTQFVDAESERVWREQAARLAEFEHIAPAHEPSSFRGELRPYQREGLGWLEFLARQRFGGCLADDMGLGKTIQVLAWLQARKEREPRAAPALIVAPKSLTHNWIEEARRFTPALTALEYVGTERTTLRPKLLQHDLVLTTYGTMRIDVEYLSTLGFGAVVLDEAQAIKNEGSRTARCVRLLRAEHRLALSGTPIENHLGELWSLFEFLNPGLLGRSSTFQTLLAASETGAIDARAQRAVAAAVRPFLLRRTKEAVLRDLPERSEQTVFCDLEAEQEREYRALRDHFRRTLLDGTNESELPRNKLPVLEMLLRLRQAACHPALLDAARASESCAKFEALFAMLEDVLETGHKALVFSQFTSFLALLRPRLDERGITYGYLDGATPAPQRAAEVARFQEDAQRKLFLISLKAGGTGLNLTAADYVFLLDPWWNPSVEAQAIARSHRIGQRRKVFAYRLICRDTIEERVLELQDKKRSLATAILEGEGVNLAELTRADLERLLS